MLVWYLFCKFKKKLNGNVFVEQEFRVYFYLLRVFFYNGEVPKKYNYEKWSKSFVVFAVCMHNGRPLYFIYIIMQLHENDTKICCTTAIYEKRMKVSCSYLL